MVPAPLKREPMTPATRTPCRSLALASVRPLMMSVESGL